MKRVVYLLSTMCLLLISCSKDEEKALIVSEHHLAFTSVGGEQEIEVTANTKWEVKYSANWLDAKTNVKSGNGSIIIHVQPNYSTTERIVLIFVTTLSGDIIEEITITQQGHIPLQVYYWDGTPFDGSFEIEGAPIPPLDRDFLSFAYWPTDFPWVINGVINKGFMEIAFRNENYCLDSTYESTSTGGIRIALIEIWQKGQRGNELGITTIKLIKNERKSPTKADNIFRTVAIFYAESAFNHGSLTLNSGWNFVEYITDFNGNTIIGKISQDINDFINEGYRWEIVQYYSTSKSKKVSG